MTTVRQRLGGAIACQCGKLRSALSIGGRACMRYKPKKDALRFIQRLVALPAQMRVEVDSDIEISAKTVRELRKVAWPDNLAITTPQDRYGSVVRVSKATVAT